MKRRTVLAAVGAGLVPVARCTSDDSGSGSGDSTDEGATPDDAAEQPTDSGGNGTEDGGGDASDTTGTDDASDDDRNGDGSADAEAGDRRRYEECSREVVQYANLPETLRVEVDAALDGPYAADEIVLQQAMDVEESYVSVDDRFYRPGVTDTGSAEVLTLERVEPKAFPDPRPVTVEQYRASDLTVSVRIVAENGDVLLDETRTVAPETEREIGSVHRAGVHDVHVTVERAGTVVDEVTQSSRIDVNHRSVDVVVSEEISVGGGVAYVIPCDYDVDR